MTWFWFDWYTLGMFGLLMVGLYARDKNVNARLKNLESKNKTLSKN